MRLIFEEEALDIFKASSNGSQKITAADPGFARMGRIGPDPGTYELIERPYISVYEVREQRDTIVVLAIFHGARNRR